MAAAQGLHVEVVAAGDSATGFVDRFERWKGSRFLSDVLRAAGVTAGHFTYHLKEWYKSSGFTKPVQARRFDHSGVHLWLKPGGNGSAVKGYLTVDREVMSPEAVYNALRDYVRRQDEQRVEAAGKNPAAIDDATAEMVLLAVNAASGHPVRDTASFLIAVREELRNNSFEADGDTLAEMLLALTARGFLLDGPVPYISQKGQAWLDDPTRGVPPEPAKPPAPPRPKTAVELIEAHQEKLKRLLELPGLVAASRHRQRQLETQIEAIMGSLDAERAVEKELLSEIPDDAIRLLLEG